MQGPCARPHAAGAHSSAPDRIGGSSPRRLELNRLLAGAVHLGDHVDGMLQIAIVRGNPPEAEHDESDGDGQRERAARHGPGRLLNRVLNARDEDQDPDRGADDQEHRPEDGEDDPPPDPCLGAERHGDNLVLSRGLVSS